MRFRTRMGRLFMPDRGVLLAALLAVALPASAADGDTRLADAAMRRDAAAVRALLTQKGVDVNAPSADGTPALHWLVRVDDLATASALIRAGANASAPNRYGVRPLALAAANGNAAMIRLLLEAGADPNAVDPQGDSMLVTATGTGRLDAVQALVEAGATVDARDPNFQQTALMAAVRGNHLPIVQFFVERGADVNARTRVGATPPWVLPNSVPGFGHGVGIVRGGLPPRGRRAPIPGGLSPLLYAARDGRLDTVRYLLDRGAAIEQADPNGITPLLMAIGNNHPDVAMFLLERGAAINVVDWYGRTPLWAAIEARNMDFDNNDHVNGVDRAPYLPLIERLLAQGADPNVRTKEHIPIRPAMLPTTGTLAWVDVTGQTPFITAALAADVTVMRLLLKHKADPTIMTVEGTTALMSAAGMNWVVAQSYDEGHDARLEAVRICVELGLDVNAINSMGLTALHAAANRGDDHVIEYLVSKGARLDVKDKEGRTPLTWAEGVFLATHPSQPKPTSIALIKKLMGAAAN